MPTRRAVDGGLDGCARLSEPMWPQGADLVDEVCQWDDSEVVEVMMIGLREARGTYV